MNQSLENKVVVITGGATGIGFNIADKYLYKGVKTVILLDIDEEQGTTAVDALNKTHGKGKAVFIRCDVTIDLEDIGTRILNSYKTVDVLVNSAGIADEDRPKTVLDVNITALVLWSLKFYEHMRIDKGGAGGTIMNLASIFGFRIAPCLPIYCTSKFAVMGFTRSLGFVDNFKKTGVRVIALCPGFTRTNMTEPLLDDENKMGFTDELVTFTKNFPWQNVDKVGDGAVEVFKIANSGTAWLIEDSKAIEEVI